MTTMNTTRYMFIAHQTPPSKTKTTSTSTSTSKSKPKSIIDHNNATTKSAARAHVTKEFHRKVRLKRREVFVSTSLPSSISPEPTLGHVVVPVAVTDDEVKLNFKAEDDDDDDVIEVPSDLSIQDRRRSPSISDPIARSVIRSTLDQSRSDPFNTLAMKDMPPFLQRVLDHALVHTWPSTIPVKGIAVSLQNPVNAAWLQSSMQHPVVLHAFLYAASMHLSVLYKGHDLFESATELRFDQFRKSIALVNREISELRGPPTDAMMMAVTILAMHGQRCEILYPVIHPLSPLAEQQYLHVYGQMLVADTHINGLRMLFKWGGGVHRDMTYGMAETFALADLYFANQQGRPPDLPLYWPKNLLVLSDRYTPDSVALTMSSVLGSDFGFLYSSSPGASLCEIFELTRELTVALDQYERGAPGAPDLIDLLPARSTIQHQLLSVEFKDTETDPKETLLAQICQVAALIFSDMVIYPLPETQQRKPLLAAKLRPLLNKMNADCELYPAQHRLLLWAAALGCIASTFSTDHDWYLGQLLMRLRMVSIHDWPALQQLCSIFLWWAPVCDPPGKLVWSEIQYLYEMRSEGIEYG